jgi:predicted nucleic-acid-binding protein
MRAVDTNVLVRLATRDDSRQLAAAESFVAGGAWVSHVVLAEFVWVLTSVYDLRAPRVVTAIEVLLGHENLTLQDPEVVSAALAQFKKNAAVAFSDCLALELARKAGHLPLGTFDRGLSRLSGAERL